jgi:RES domain-containing protein
MLDPRLIELVDQLPRTSFFGEAFRHQGPGYPPLNAEGSRIHGGRWNPRESFPVLYLARSEATAAAEFYRPGSFISDRLIFGTYQNAGVRVFDIGDAYRPKEVGALVPPAPKRMVDQRPRRPRVIQTADVFATAEGLVYLTDYTAGLYTAEYTG